jgi:putative endonuclease
MKNNNYKLGKYGEKIAENYLIENKYKILQRNFYCRQGEIDIIAEYKNYIVFIEVKTRKTLKYGTPAEAVTHIKKKHIIETSRYYLYKNKIQNRMVRFDVIEIFIKNGKVYLNHIKQII